MTGRKANGVEPGKQLQMMSPLAGVEQALALDHAAGGSDAEPLDSARRRAAAKVRHGGRILSRADLEDYATTLSPDIAQVRAPEEAARSGSSSSWRERRRAPPGAIARVRHRDMRGSGYGLARPAGSNVVGRACCRWRSASMCGHAARSFAEAAAKPRPRSPPCSTRDRQS